MNSETSSYLQAVISSQSEYMNEYVESIKRAKNELEQYTNSAIQEFSKEEILLEDPQALKAAEQEFSIFLANLKILPDSYKKTTAAASSTASFFQPQSQNKELELRKAAAKLDVSKLRAICS